MAKYRIVFTNVEYGIIDVEADSLGDAMKQAYSLDGDYRINTNEVTDASFLEVVDE